MNIVRFSNKVMGKTENLIIDFEKRSVKIDRGSSELYTIEFPFDDITAIEMNPAFLLSGPIFSFILKGKKIFVSNSNGFKTFLANVTLSKSDSKSSVAVIERLAKECKLSGVGRMGSNQVEEEKYEMQYSEQLLNEMKTQIKVANELAKNGEIKKRCNVCGHIFCYTQADMDNNLRNAKKAVLSSVGQIAGAVGGAYTASAINQSNAENSSSKIIDFNRCPQCKSTNLSVITDKELEALKSQNNTPQSSAPAVSVADELKKFKELLDMGAISQEEYDQKKKELLDL